jgi:hypothetical protein
MRPLLGKLALFTTGLVTALGFAACGGSTHKTVTSSAAKSATTSLTKSKSAPSAKLSETVEVPAPTGGRLASTAAAKPGDAVLFHTSLSGTSHSTVRLSLTQGPGPGWSVTATAGGHKSTAKITSSTRRKLTLVDLRYSCLLPPSPTFCPASHVSRTAGGGYQLQFRATPSTGVTVAATIGPAANPAPTAVSPGTANAPPYGVVAVSLAEPSNPASASTAKVHFAGSVKAAAGDILLLAARVTGDSKGSPQPLTITVDRGPSRTLVASASVPGGRTETTTIRSTTGAPITIASAYYECYVAPTATFCPATSVHARAGAYTVTFPVSPVTPAIVLHTRLQQG